LSSSHFDLVFETIKTLQNLERINIGNNYFKESEYQKLLSWVFFESKLKRLELPFTELSGKDLDKIAKGISANQVLEAIDMMCCAVCFSNIKSINEALRMNPKSKLSLLKLNMNPIYNSECKQFLKEPQPIKDVIEMDEDLLKVLATSKALY